MSDRRNTLNCRCSCRRHRYRPDTRTRRRQDRIRRRRKRIVPQQHKFPRPSSALAKKPPTVQMLLTSESLRRNGHDEAAAAEVKHEELPADKSTEPVAYTALFRYATRQDKLLLALGMFGAIGTGE